MSRLLHTDRYTIREVVLDSPITDNAWEAATVALEFAFDELKLPGHLFVTVVNADMIHTDSGEGIGHYNEVERGVLIAAGDFSTLYEDGPVDESEACGIIASSVIHECLHYKQDLDGTVESSEANEIETERMTEELMEKLIAIRKAKLENAEQ